MSVVLDRPYEFVPPHRGNLWPFFIQRFRIVDRYLRRKEGVVSYECRNLEQFSRALKRGDGILLAPNHCRYADPLALGWPAREAKAHVYAMASWHLFNKGWFDSFAIRKMGGFSINREGTDRQSLETAINILATAERPLILFPEGTTNRTNDVLKPLLEGVSFIARSAARRRSKADGGTVVMLPIAIKYLCKGDYAPWAERQLSGLERRFCWSQRRDRSILERTRRVVEGFLALKEIDYLGSSQSGPLPQRRQHLISFLLDQTEARLGITSKSLLDSRSRIRAIRTEIVAQYYAEDTSAEKQQELRQDVEAADLSLELLSYPENYLKPGFATDTRVVETIQRLQEFHFGDADASVPLHAVIQFGEAIDVPPAKAPRDGQDPILQELQKALSSMIEALSHEARSLSET